MQGIEIDSQSRESERHNKNSRNSYLRHRDKILRKQKEYYLNNPDKLLKRRNYSNEYYFQHREEISRKRKLYRELNPEKVLEKRARHRIKDLAHKKDVYSKNPLLFKDRSLKRRYGMSLLDYDRMYQIQGGKCPICSLHQTQLNKPLIVDHNHKTGKVRGLLCPTCNFLIGYAHDDVAILKKAILYLEKIYE